RRRGGQPRSTPMQGRPSTARPWPRPPARGRPATVRVTTDGHGYLPPAQGQQWWRRHRGGKRG
ncbi:hypothetical protein BHE74_00057617, partial [Ensete ventricosum]